MTNPMDHLTDSLMPLTLNRIKHICKTDLRTIILTREITLRNTINEYESSLKSRDKYIFINQRNEIKRLERLLIDDSELYREFQKLKTQNKNLKEKLKKHIAIRYL